MFNIADEKLTGEQKKVLTLPDSGPVLIKGGAGSGKTLIAVKRALHLASTGGDLFRGLRVGIFAYNKALVETIKAAVSEDRVFVDNIDHWVFDVLSRLVKNGSVHLDERKWISRHPRFGIGLKWVSDECVERSLQTAQRFAFASIGQRAIANKPMKFYEEEIRWLKGRRIKTLDAYIATPRTGRGTADRVTAEDRRYLWAMFESYNQSLDTMGAHDFADNTELLLSLIESGRVSVSRYSHIVIDEAQDLTLAQMQLIGKLVNPETNSITIVADMAQQIYGKGFSWKETGITIAGARSFEFTHNYRNTRQISEAAYALIDHEEDKAEFTEMIASQREGEKPRLVQGDCSRWDAMIRQSLAALPPEETVVIGCTTHRVMRQLKERFGAGTSRVEFSTLHALKGRQFDHVFLWDVSDRALSLADADENDVSKARKLLYVSMTRACKTLTLFNGGDESRLLNEIPAELLDVVTLNA